MQEAPSSKLPRSRANLRPLAALAPRPSFLFPKGTPLQHAHPVTQFAPSVLLALSFAILSPPIYTSSTKTPRHNGTPSPLPNGPPRRDPLHRNTPANNVAQAQTPQQRQANMRFAKAQEKKMGKPEGPQIVKPRGPQKSPISKIWISTSLSTLDRGNRWIHMCVDGLTQINSFAGVCAVRRPAVRGPEAVLLGGQSAQYYQRANNAAGLPLDRGWASSPWIA